nr:PREDICTED: uncharacterized protein C9orf135 homolog isoform X4 [Anolis carolinensis]|eukprot:XP_016846507.1 PREDICTED: uncharacterized protein C9orf135 homolog isoform X4 [Anolis carolinensis]
MDQKWITTNQDFLSQPYRIKEYKELEIPTLMLDKDNFEIGVLKRLLDTTYHIDYVPPYDYQPYVTLDPAGYSVVHRKCHSQFCDTADYRRHGINTWQDESGVYANADLRQKVFPVVNPIPTNVEEEKP